MARNQQRGKTERAAQRMDDVEYILANPPEGFELFEDQDKFQLPDHVLQFAKDHGMNVDWNGYFGGIKNYYATSKGEMWSFPYNSSTAMFYWNKDAWAKIAGKKGEKIIHIRTVTAGSTDSRQIDTITTGHYF